MEIQHRLKNCYCFSRSVGGGAAKVEALNLFGQEERLWRDQPREASVLLACPTDTQYIWAIIVIQDWSEARMLEAVDPGASADPRDGRISFEVSKFEPLLMVDNNRPLQVQMPANEKRRLEYKPFRFGDSDEPFGYWVRTS
jgi:hypothetical protein